MSAESLSILLDSYRNAARTERDKGTYFERLSIAFLTHDPIQAEQYEDVKPYSDWAMDRGWDGRDIGIDLVAKLRDEDGYAAIQCKFYDAAHRIRKKDIDSFIAASGREPFKRRAIVDTTETPWTENAETTIRGQAIPTIRIGLDDLRQSPIRWDSFAAKGDVVLADKKKELYTRIPILC
ncbi:MAG: restriction endonuclease [Rhodobacteraceae bacterium]|nr:restriction endonuclease [Paracoccaceae bacterium]